MFGFTVLLSYTSETGGVQTINSQAREISVPQKVVKRKPTNLILSAEARLSVWGHLSVSAFTYFFSQLIVDSLEMIFLQFFIFLYIFFIEVFGCFLGKKKTYDALTLHFFWEGTFDWSLISQASPQWMDPRVDLTQVLSISRSALLSLIRGLHVWGKNVHRARCTY